MREIQVIFTIGTFFQIGIISFAFFWNYLFCILLELSLLHYFGITVHVLKIV